MVIFLNFRFFSLNVDVDTSGRVDTNGRYSAWIPNHTCQQSDL